MRYRDLLTEKVLEPISSPYSTKEYMLYQNPSAAEFRAVMDNLTPDREYETERLLPGTMRGLLVPTTSEILMWDGFAASHGSIIDTHHLAGSFHLILKPDTVKVLTLWRYERNGFDEESVRKLVAENSYLKRMYRGAFQIVIQP